LLCLADGSINKSALTNPGPGNYNANYKTGIQKSPDWKVGTSKRKDLSDGWAKKTPAPGTYESKQNIGEGPKYDMGHKLIPGGSMNTGMAYVPGPGSYTPNKRIYDPSIKYSMGLKTDAPAQMIIQPDGSTKTIATLANRNPGPGTYKAQTPNKNARNGNRFGSELRQGMARPGTSVAPNQYNRDAKESVIKKAPSYGFGTSKRAQSASTARQTPGPGTYKLKGIVGTETQGKSLGLRTAHLRNSAAFVPGPGTYNSPA
jgi:hypothetical protein